MDGSKKESLEWIQREPVDQIQLVQDMLPRWG